jgi:hypothetical protein
LQRLDRRTTNQDREKRSEGLTVQPHWRGSQSDHGTLPHVQHFAVLVDQLVGFVHEYQVRLPAVEH